MSDAYTYVWSPTHRSLRVQDRRIYVCWVEDEHKWYAGTNPNLILPDDRTGRTPDEAVNKHLRAVSARKGGSK